MSERTFETDALDHLLGRLSEAERERFEVRLLEEDRGDELQAIESDLQDRAVRGELGPVEQALFDKNYKTLPGRAAQLVHARALWQAAQAGQAAPSAAVLPFRPRWGRSVLVAVGLAAAAALAVVVMSERVPKAPLKDQPAPVLARTPTYPPAPPAPAPPPVQPAPPPREEAPAEPHEKPVMLALALNTTRAGTGPKLALPASARQVVLQVDLEGDTRWPAFSARLTGPTGAEVWAAPRLQADRKAGLLELHLPSAALSSGPHRLSIAGLPAQGPPSALATLVFEVVR